jgi:hypothetical protein
MVTKNLVYKVIAGTRYQLIKSVTVGAGSDFFKKGAL